MNNLKIDFNAPLNIEDSERQTIGWRSNNPLICKNNGIEDVCAFCTTDHICRQTSRAWKKQYKKLSEEV